MTAHFTRRRRRQFSDGLSVDRQRQIVLVATVAQLDIPKFAPIQGVLSNLCCPDGGGTSIAAFLHLGNSRDHGN